MSTLIHASDFVNKLWNRHSRHVKNVCANNSIEIQNAMIKKLALNELESISYFTEDNQFITDCKRILYK